MLEQYLEKIPNIIFWTEKLCSCSQELWGFVQFTMLLYESNNTKKIPFLEHFYFGN